MTTPPQTLLLSILMVLSTALLDGCARTSESTTSGGATARDGGSSSDASGDADRPQEAGQGSPLTCGDGVRVGAETCDDGNLLPFDGCDARCLIEPGYSCPNEGERCRATRCGDAIVAGNEQCEDGNVTTGDGCDGCRLEPGWACDKSTPVSPCYRTVCNDGKREGDEPCDDGNSVLGDGCSPFCQVEPRCESGTCTSVCGDNLKLGDEACDDGNTQDGDGCSATCQVELTYTCYDVASELPASFALPVIYRDFIRAATNGASKHPDFEEFLGSDPTEGMVAAELTAQGKPAYTGICQRLMQIGPCPQGDQTTSKLGFDQWYSDDTTKFTLTGLLGDAEGIRSPSSGAITGTMLKVVDTIQMIRLPGQDAYQNETFGKMLFPLDGKGWVKASLETPYLDHNFGFTSEIRHWFEFKGGETLTFSGDDDVWVFINGQLALDLGGLHPRREGTIVLDAQTGDASCFQRTDQTTPCKTPTRPLRLKQGQVYEMAIFHAERRAPESNFDLTLTGFASVRSQCVSSCGDGIVQADQGEQCDDGNRIDDDGCDRDCQAALVF